MADTMAPPEPRYSPPPYEPRTTLGDQIERLVPAVRATPARAAAAALVAALALVCVVALQPVQATGTDDIGSFKADCGISMYLFGHPSTGVEQVCRDAYAGHAVAVFAAGGALLAALAVLVVLLIRPAPEPTTQRTGRLRALVATPSRASAVAVASVLLFVALGSLLPAHVEADSPQGAFSAQCGLSIFVFGHSDAAVQHACRDAYGTRGRTFFASIAALAIIGVAVTASVHNERRRAQSQAGTDPP